MSDTEKIIENKMEVSKAETVVLKEIGGKKEKKRKFSIRRLIYSIIEGGFSPWDKIVDYFVLFLIFQNVLFFLISTIPEIEENFETVMEWIEGIFIILFTIEYVLRVYVCVERKSLKRKGWLLGRISYIFRFMSLVDLVAIVPWYIMLIVPSMEVDFVSAIRVLRIFKLLKAEKYTKSMTALWEVTKRNSQILVITSLLGFVIFMFTSVALYYSERNIDPETYASIPAAMIVALFMLTGQGNPEGAVSNIGYWIISVTALFSVAVFAVPAGIIGFGFEGIAGKFQKAPKAKSAGSESDTTDSQDSFFFFTDSDEEEQKPGFFNKAEKCPHCDHDIIFLENGDVGKITFPKAE